MYYDKVHNDAHKNLFQYKTFIKPYQFDNSITILLKVKILFKCIAYIMYKSAIKHVGTKLGKSL